MIIPHSDLDGISQSTWVIKLVCAMCLLFWRWRCVNFWTLRHHHDQKVSLGKTRQNHTKIATTAPVIWGKKRQHQSVSAKMSTIWFNLNFLIRALHCHQTQPPFIQPSQMHHWVCNIRSKSIYPFLCHFLQQVAGMLLAIIASDKKILFSSALAKAPPFFLSSLMVPPDLIK